ncbi:hypothetical protein GXW82_10820 [Streptacidiphilus sp. 4-A2]|nr:hypothetical protein [Streptacidiphilus sp. 4-A2]
MRERAAHPPVAVVFSGGGGVGRLAVRNRMRGLTKATRAQWRGDTRSHPYTDYTNAIPIVVTTLALLDECGPLAPIWWRFGHTGRETLHDALLDHDDADAYWRERDAREKAEKAARMEAGRRRREAEREASRCLVCRRPAEDYEQRGQAMRAVRGRPGRGR